MCAMKNTKRNRWNQKRNHVRLPKRAVTATEVTALVPTQGIMPALGVDFNMNLGYLNGSFELWDYWFDYEPLINDYRTYGRYPAIVIDINNNVYLEET